MIVLYSTHCPRCNVLTQKLASKGVEFQEINDTNLMIQKGISSVPALEVDGVMMNFIEANQWVNRKDILNGN